MDYICTKTATYWISSKQIALNLTATIYFCSLSRYSFCYELLLTQIKKVLQFGQRGFLGSAWPRGTGLDVNTNTYSVMHETVILLSLESVIRRRARPLARWLLGSLIAQLDVWCCFHPCLPCIPLAPRRRSPSLKAATPKMSARTSDKARSREDPLAICVTAPWYQRKDARQTDGQQGSRSTERVVVFYWEFAEQWAGEPGFSIGW